MMALTETLIREKQQADDATIVEMWNAKARDAASCWAGAQRATPELLGKLTARSEFAIAERNGEVSGFLLLRPETGELLGLHADSQATYYVLVIQYCQWCLARGVRVCFAGAPPAGTAERGWQDTLAEALTLTPYGFEAVKIAGDERIAKLFRVSGDPAAVRDLASKKLAELSATKLR